jgi:hypothetical protein
MKNFVSFAQHAVPEPLDKPGSGHFGVASKDYARIFRFEGTGRASAFFEERGRVANDRL